MVPDLMDNFIKVLPILDSWETHNKFEKIHCFTDLNGRVGRLIWLRKAIDEGYNFEIPFLQMYYYQTLQHYEKGKLL
jgi:Fic family protein